MPAPVLYDHRETASGVAAALADHDVPLAARDLPVGDYVVSDRVVVERKTGADLAASIKDRRVFEQIERMRAAYAVAVLVVEGDPKHISRASWMGALARVLVAGVAVVRTENADDTARWLARMYHVDARDRPTSAACRGGAGPPRTSPGWPRTC